MTTFPKMKRLLLRLKRKRVKHELCANDTPKGTVKSQSLYVDDQLLALSMKTGRTEMLQVNRDLLNETL